ncbi:MAG: hypothetical protein FDZ70_07565 [Actinobacteria bacterium]|nr:MAG: hypothetical protein FDZ70_07565 [Actinomycetota bacterium]
MRIWMTAVAALVIALALPSAAFALEPAYTTHVQTTSRTTGIDAAEEALRMIRAVQVGTAATTLTIEVGGAVQDVRVDYGEIAGRAAGQGAPGDGGYAPYAVVALLATMMSRAFRMLGRVTRVRVH